MKEPRRSYLTGTIRLSENPDGTAPEQYTIKSVIGEGGSSVCYEAVRTRRGGRQETGKLKEFYPFDGVGQALHRLPSGLLVPGPGVLSRFEGMCQEYLETCNLLRQAMVADERNEVLKNYIQTYQELYSRPAETELAGETEAAPEMLRRATVYVWTPGFQGKGFDVYLKEVRRDPARCPEQKLETILQVVSALNNCVKALHIAGLLHQDIKPSNFLLMYDSDFKVRPDSISVFDINTLRAVDSTLPMTAGTPGFCAPEVKYGRSDNRSDLYSIGAVLFNAIVIHDAVPDGLYRDELYPNLKQLLAESRLFKESVVNSDARLMARLYQILKNCLAPNPRARCRSCEQLQKDLDYVCERMRKIRNLPLESAKKLEADPTVALQKLLYEHPLYEAAPARGGALNVLVLGAGSYGQRFLDVCLQTGQMLGTELHITAVSEEPEENKTAYLTFRPALPEFVNVDGSLQGREADAYATLDFCDVKTVAEGEVRSLQETDAALVRQLLHKNGVQYHYVFVALGEDRISYRVAERVAKELKEVPVCYIQTTRSKRSRTPRGTRLYGVSLIDPLETAAIDKSRALDEMAFNTHLSWNSSLNIDMTEERRKFFSGKTAKERYNFTASLAFVLSIPYKLRALNIAYDDPQKAARRFSEEILARRETDPEARQKFDKTVAMEHRRWVLEKVTAGWTAPRTRSGLLDLESCLVHGKVKNETCLTHPCIVRSDAASPLSDEAFSREQWDEGPLPQGLDDLDRMSLLLHRTFRRQALCLRDGACDADLDRIQEQLLPAGEAAQRAFQAYRFAVRNVLEGSEIYAKQYRHYHDSLTAALQPLQENTRNEIERRLNVLRRTLFPAVESCLYRNYKAYDEALVKNIPFILAYHHTAAMAQLFEDDRLHGGRNEAVFTNVAAASVLSPEQICFLYRMDGQTSVPQLMEKLQGVLRYLGGRKVRCSVQFVACALQDAPAGASAQLKRQLEELQARPAEGNAVLDQCEVFAVEDDAAAGRLFAGYLKNHPVDLFDADTALCASQAENRRFLQRLKAQKLPYFQFDRRTKQFTKQVGCSGLQYLQDASFFRVSDLFALMGTARSSFRLPEYAEDGPVLWQIYTQNQADSLKESVRSWNVLCGVLGMCHEMSDVLADIPVPGQEKKDQTLLFYLPNYALSTAAQIVRMLKEHGIAHEDSSVSRYAADTCKVLLQVPAYCANAVRQAFAQPQFLLPYYGVSCALHTEKKGQEHLVLRFNDLNASLFLPEEQAAVLHPVLEQLAAAQFIRELKLQGGSICFCYSSPRIKAVLTDARKILELHAYNQVMQTGYFDDVAVGCTFQQGGQTQELSLVLTKGFRSMVVVCGTAAQWSAECARQLEEQINAFGVDTEKILLLDGPVPAKAGTGWQVIAGAEQMADIGLRLAAQMRARAEEAKAAM